MQIQNSTTKGQIISKCPFGVKTSSQTNEIFSKISALASKKRSNRKNKGTLYMEVSIDGGTAHCHFFISETKRDFD